MTSNARTLPHTSDMWCGYDICPHRWSVRRDDIGSPEHPWRMLAPHGGLRLSQAHHAACIDGGTVATQADALDGAAEGHRHAHSEALVGECAIVVRCSWWDYAFPDERMACPGGDTVEPL